LRRRRWGVVHAYVCGVVRLQVRPPARRGRRVRLPLPPQPVLDRRVAAVQRPRCTRARVRPGPTRDEGVPRQGRRVADRDHPVVRARGEVVPDDRPGVHGGSSPFGGAGRGAGRAVPRPRHRGVGLPSGRGALTPPAVVALGGGHGTAVTLRAARRYAGSLTAVVSVADDGGSSGRLREILNVVALGDLRKCLVALAAEDSALALAFEHRFDEGELAGHALGNLILAGLVDATGDLVDGVRAAAELLGAAGDVLPATVERGVLKAESGGGQV